MRYQRNVVPNVSLYLLLVLGPGCQAPASEGDIAGECVDGEDNDGDDWTDCIAPVLSQNSIAPVRPH